MTFFADLTPYAYGDSEHDTVQLGRRRLHYRPHYERRNVGWLDESQPFRTGPVPDWFPAALLAALGRPRVNTYRGLHDCQFCPPGAQTIADPRPGQEWLAYYEVRVPAGPDVMFAAPALVWHYVTAHEYLPPEEFVEAVRHYDAGWADVPSPWVPSDAEIG